MGRQPGWGVGENTVKREGGEGRGTGYSARLLRRRGGVEEGQGAKGTLNPPEEREWEQENSGRSRETEGWGGGGGVGRVVSVCVVIKRFMGVEGEGGAPTLPTAALPFVFFELGMCRQAWVGVGVGVGDVWGWVGGGGVG